MSQNESTTFLVTDAKNLTLMDATRENSPWWEVMLLMMRRKLLMMRMFGPSSESRVGGKRRCLKLKKSLLLFTLQEALTK